jgi:hypothetical protein
MSERQLHRAIPLLGQGNPRQTELDTQGPEFDIRQTAIGEQDDVYPFWHPIVRRSQPCRLIFKGDPTAEVPQDFPDHGHRPSPIDDVERYQTELAPMTRLPGEKELWRLPRCQGVANHRSLQRLPFKGLMSEPVHEARHLTLGMLGYRRMAPSG